MVDVKYILEHWNEIIKFAEGEEKIILNSGRTLTFEETVIAKEMGVKYPEKVRILEIDEIVKPKEPVLHKICEDFNFINNPNGLTFGYAFYLKTEHRNSTIPHELVHVSQYEGLGIQGFFERYYKEYCECNKNGKLKRSEMPLEKDAKEKAKSFCESIGIAPDRKCIERFN
jgi:hypothetical protein